MQQGKQWSPPRTYFVIANFFLKRRSNGTDLGRHRPPAAFPLSRQTVLQGELNFCFPTLLGYSRDYVAIRGKDGIYSSFHHFWLKLSDI